MAYLPIYRGATPNDNTGDNLREGARKINSNFAEIYGALGNGSSITFNYNTYKLNEISDVSVPLPLNEQVLAWDTATSMWQAVDKLSGNVVGHMIPTNANNTWDLGSQLYNFRDIYLAGNAIFNPGEQKLYSDNGTLKVQYNYQTSNATLLDTNDSTAATITPGSPSDDVYFSNTSVMDSLTVGGTTVYLFPGIDLSTSAPYGLLPNVTVELTLANASFSNTYTNYDNSVYGQPQAVHADAFYFSGPTSVTVKIGDVSPANTAQMPRQIYNDLLNADSARLEIIRTSSDGIGEVLISNKTQTITNKTIPAANNSILMSIGDLFDVINSGANTASDGDTLVFRASSNTWIPGSSGSHPISGAIVNGHLLPTANDAFDLGSPTSQFKDLYMTGNSIHLGSTTISSAGGKVSFGGAALSAPLEITDHLIPDQNEAYDLGSATHKFRDLYLSSATLNLGTSSLSVGPDGLTFTETAPVVLYKDTIQNLNPNINSQYFFYKPSELIKLQLNTPEADANFGEAVAMTDSRIVVGAPYKDGASNTNEGAAYVYDSSGNYIAELQSLSTTTRDNYGSSVAVSSNRIVVGAYAKDSSPTVSDKIGAAYLFDIDGNQIAELLASDATLNDNFGISVAVSDSIVVVGSPGVDSVAINTGAVYLFDINGNQTMKIQADSPEQSAGFGNSVAVSSNRIVVGANSSDSNIPDSGAAYVFNTSGTQLKKIGPSSGSAYADYGWSIAVSDTRIIVGAPNTKGTYSGQGAAYLYDIDGNEIAKLTAYDGQSNDFFGTTVAISNERIIVGAPLEDTTVSNSGSVYIYDLDGKPLAKMQASDPDLGAYFGWSVAITDTKIVVGAPQKYSGVPSTGAAYVYEQLGAVTEPQIFGINGLDGIGKTSDWPEAVIANNHILFSPETSFTAELTLYEATGAQLHKFNLLSEGAGDWTDDPANGFTNIDTVNEGLIIDKFGKFWIKTPTDQAGFENYMQGVTFATFSILNIQNATPAKPLKPVDNPASISTANVPSSSGSTGTKGDMVVDSTHLYVCTDTDTWVRILLTDTSW